MSKEEMSKNVLEIVRNDSDVKERVSLWSYQQSDIYFQAVSKQVLLNGVVIWERTNPLEPLPKVNQCMRCGAFELEADLYTEAGYIYCRKCYDTLPVCDDCGKKILGEPYVIHNTDGTEAKTVCGVCAYEYPVCSHCNKLFLKLEGSYCLDCLANRKTCDICGQSHWREEVAELDGEHVCNKCNPSIACYHHTGGSRFVHLDTPKDNERARNMIGCGFELEVEPRPHLDDSDPNALTRHRLRKFFHHYSDVEFKHDGSLNCGGFEIVSKPHTFEALRALPFADMVEYLQAKGYRSHDGGNCGLHLHVSRTAFGKTPTLQEYNIAKLLFFIDWYWDDIVKVSRRQNFDYCERPYALQRQVTFESKQKRASQLAKDGFGGRYYAINLENYNTVEFRFMRGTLSPSTFKACIDFLLVISRRIKKVKYSDIVYNPELVLKGIDKNTLTYLKRHNAFTDVIEKIETHKDNYKPRCNGGGKISHN